MVRVVHLRYRQEIPSVRLISTERFLAGSLRSTPVQSRIGWFPREMLLCRELTAEFCLTGTK